MSADEAPVAALGPAAPPRPRLLAVLAAWGTGLLVMLADTDAGNIVTAADAGMQWRYRLLPLVLLLIPMLYVLQELAARLGLFVGKGFAELVRERFGRLWAALAVAALAVATLGSLITEFTGIAGVGDLYGAPRWAVLPLAAVCLLLVVLTGEYRRVERVAVAIGLFELSFFLVAWAAHPSLGRVLHDAVRPQLRSAGFLYLGAALIGATFNPWMVFYQASALAEKQLGVAYHAAMRADTALGAVLTQLVTAAVLVAAAATLAGGEAPTSLDSIGQISDALTPLLGGTVGRLVFSLGVVGAAMVAAIVCSLAFAWALGEVAGLQHALERRALDRRWFYAAYALFVCASALLVFGSRDLVWLSIASQVVNAVLLPLVAGLLIVLAATVLPHAVRLRGVWLWIVVATAAGVSIVGLIGTVAGLAS